MKLTAEQLYKKLVDDYKVIGETGSIKFTVKDLSILVKTKDTVGNRIVSMLNPLLFIHKYVHATPKTLITSLLILVLFQLPQTKL